MVIQNNEAKLNQIITVDAIKSISSSNNIIAEASKYLNFKNLPSQTFFSIGNNILNEKGILNFSINVDKYYDLTSFTYINQNKTFNNIWILGFKPVYSIKEYPITPINEPPKQVSDKTVFYDKVVNNVLDRAFISQFLDLRAIPETAKLSILNIRYGNDNSITLTIASNQVYGKSGVFLRKNFKQQF